MKENLQVSTDSPAKTSLNVDMMSLIGGEPVLVCPRTKQPLTLKSRDEACDAMSSGELAPRANVSPPPFGVSAQLLVRADGQCAYPIVDGIPVLLAPEQITAADRLQEFDLTDPRYAEAYEEMVHYNEVARREALTITKSQPFQSTEPVMRLSEEERRTFPEPKEVWVDDWHNSISQYEAFAFLRPIAGQRVLQLGGKGIHAVKFLLAGAREAWVVTPMLGEALCSVALAREAGVEQRLRTVVAVAEELPLADNLFDIVYSGGCVHHMTTELALPEAARVLKPGGRFAAVDPWRAPLYAIGTKVFGKQDPNVFCRPLTEARVTPLFSSFASARTIQHGSLTRYPAIALGKLGIRMPGSMWWWMTKCDDAVCSLIPGMRRLGSCVTLCAIK
jgi:ubiquinone/menaquinone biosynthesis C-methylase UbiE/uncharacterized protein YbaR (Trm112 family)